MARGPHVHAIARLSPQVGWCPSGESLLTEDETTAKVPEHLVTLAMAIEDDLVADSYTQPMSSAPGPPSAVHSSGIVPAGTAAAGGFDVSLDELLEHELPFRAEADNEQLAPAPLRRHVLDYSLTSRAAISRTAATAVIALAAVVALFVIGGRPLTVRAPAARTAVTVRARADRAGTSGMARAPRTTTTVFIASAPAAPAPETRRAPAPNRVAKASGHIIRTLPF